MTTLLSVLLSLTLASAARMSSKGSMCCVNAETDYKPQTLMKMCQFLLSDPHEESDAARLKNAQKCMNRMRLDELQLPDMKISKLPKDSKEMAEAIDAATAFTKANLTTWQKSYWFWSAMCPPGMVELKNQVIKSWRCDEVDLQLVELTLTTPVNRFESRKLLDQTEQAIASAAAEAQESKKLNEKFKNWKEGAEDYIAVRKEEKAKEDKILDDVKQKIDKLVSKYS
eukprot:Skav229249  [mRNA]  locus=scaffold2154:233912:234592:+ [translate_table: standard]